MSAIPAKKIECNRYNPVGRNQICPERNQEYMLAKRWREHGDRDAADQLVTSHLRLPVKRQEWRKGSKPRQAAPCSINHNPQCLQGPHLADVG